MRRSVLMTAALGLLLAGCGGTKELPRGPVKGRVTMGNQPVAGATVTFESKGVGVAQTASTDDSGNYEFESYNATGLPAGSYKVTVSSGRFMQPGEEIPRIDPTKKPAAPPKPKTTTIPDKYAKAETSGLSAEVKAGQNEPFNFDLKP
jgi:hypothetical protein